jgi:hypothetical protein
VNTKYHGLASLQTKTVPADGYRRLLVQNTGSHTVNRPVLDIIENGISRTNEDLTR